MVCPPKCIGQQSVIDRAVRESDLMSRSSNSIVDTVKPNGPLIRQDRIAQKLSQDALCSKTASKDGRNRGISVETLRRAEKGNRVTRESLSYIANALGRKIERYIVPNDSFGAAKPLGTDLRIHHLDDEIGDWSSLFLSIKLSIEQAFWKLGKEIFLDTTSEGPNEFSFEISPTQTVKYVGYETTNLLASGIRWNSSKLDIVILDVLMRESELMIASTGLQALEHLPAYIPDERIAIFSGYSELIKAPLSKSRPKINIFNKADHSQLENWVVQELMNFAGLDFKKGGNF